MRIEECSQTFFGKNRSDEDVPEIWDAYLPNGTLAGCNLVRGEPIPNGLYHLVGEILVRHADSDYLLMQRDPRKPNYGGFFEATAGGSALKGEDAYCCARRELQEETGINPVHSRISDDLYPTIRSTKASSVSPIVTKILLSSRREKPYPINGSVKQNSLTS